MRPDVAAWIKQAEEDLFTAETLLSFKKPAPWIICFHAQQAAEKFLKAFLIIITSRFQKRMTSRPLFWSAPR
ncbi:HEPN domain protein [Thermococcus sp. 4557]|nr:HEPN domain-containing protein [Thermococcus sp. 4557]AEK73674.1 HEPN domain protein [Thermococcus sp. 4557]